MNQVHPIHRCYITDSGIAIGIAHQEQPPQHDTDALAIQDALLADNNAADAEMLQWLAYGACLAVAVIGVICLVFA